MSEVIEIPAKEELDRHFSAMGDSVDLINGYVAGSYQGRTITKDDDAKDTVSRNVEHLKIMIDKQKNPLVVTPSLPWAQTQGA
jgi:hypothetical protein